MDASTVVASSIMLDIVSFTLMRIAPLARVSSPSMARIMPTMASIVSPITPTYVTMIMKHRTGIQMHFSLVIASKFALGKNGLIMHRLV